MRIEVVFAVFFMICISCSCIQKPGRPDAPLCTVTSENGECTDVRGDFVLDHAQLLCTSVDGYSTLERYVDQLELKVRDLERRCKR
jgi:hypothetical protein